MDLNKNWPSRFDANEKTLMVLPETVYVGIKEITGNGDNDTEFTKVTSSYN
jgi:hypothetical protein